MIADSAWRKHQMPAYHLMAPDRSGITLVNIGVGPSNAKTITDHLAVVRPEAWLMIGPCGGLRPVPRLRSEGRRVGKGWVSTGRLGWEPVQSKKKKFRII